jgi:hypothetical protein
MAGVAQFNINRALSMHAAYRTGKAHPTTGASHLLAGGLSWTVPPTVRRVGSKLNGTVPPTVRRVVKIDRRTVGGTASYENRPSYSGWHRA